MYEHVFHCAEFHEVRSHSVNFFLHILYRILFKSDEKCRKYKAKLNLHLHCIDVYIYTVSMFTEFMDTLMALRGATVSKLILIGE
jgi:hypothetical protein